VFVPAEKIEQIKNHHKVTEIAQVSQEKLQPAGESQRAHSDNREALAKQRQEEQRVYWAQQAKQNIRQHTANSSKCEPQNLDRDKRAQQGRDLSVQGVGDVVEYREHDNLVKRSV
jgi:hypothetical protein